MTTPSAPPSETPQKKGNCFLWGCLTVIILFIVTFCCLGTLFLLPFFTDYDPLGIDLRNRIEQYIPWGEFLEDPSAVPGLPDFLDSTLDPLEEEAPGELTSAAPGSGAQAISLTTYIPSDFQAVFDYPTGWEIETEEHGVTFYDTQSYTYLYVGEYLVDEGMTARQAAEDMRDSLIEESQEDTFTVVESTPFIVPTGDDAYLLAYEFTDLDGYYQWALDLETVSGESNIFFYIWGKDPNDYQLYRDLIEIIAASFSR
jgi:hypothetical protein